jgi:hypothetical protein
MVAANERKTLTKRREEEITMGTPTRLTPCGALCKREKLRSGRDMIGDGNAL